MYSVVGCSECRHLWVVEGRPETSRCPRCRTRHRFESLKAFAETDTSDAAARVRSSMLADRADDGEFLDPAEVDTESVGIDDEAYLSASGVDADTAAAAGERATDSGGSRSRREVVLDALSELEEPTAADVRAYAAEAGVPESYVEKALEKLRRAGEVTESDGVYRRL
jgi:predicted Zn-ribbon and HTH transcriptional regulator